MSCNSITKENNLPFNWRPDHTHRREIISLLAYLLLLIAHIFRAEVSKEELYASAKLDGLENSEEFRPSRAHPASLQPQTNAGLADEGTISIINNQTVNTAFKSSFVMEHQLSNRGQRNKLCPVLRRWNGRHHR